MNNAKKLYENEAEEFDYVIPTLIPYYNEIYNILIDSIPFKKEETIEILDIGCGTGTLAKNLKEKFPNSKVTCLDFSKNMIKIAQNKLSKYKDDIDFLVSDFNNVNSNKKYDVIVSSFALHHIPTDGQKISLYKNIFNMLNINGTFLNADLVLGSNHHIKNLNYQKWKEHIMSYFNEIEILDELIPKYQAGDNPSVLFNHLKWLDNTGFKEVETIWKYFNFAIYGGRKIQLLELIQ